MKMIRKYREYLVKRRSRAVSARLDDDRYEAVRASAAGRCTIAYWLQEAIDEKLAKERRCDNRKPSKR